VAGRIIVGGLLLGRGTVLLGKRGPTRMFAPDVWDIFGGHVALGESPEAALVRELGEELGIHANRMTPLGELDDPQLPGYTCLLFLVEDWEGVPENRCPEEHTEIRWVSVEEVEHIPLAHPAYPALFRRMLTQHQRTR
jgi:8-oxo-dGTP diphosphatase